MANKMCDLCQNAYAKDMRFGVKLCEGCLAEYTAAVRKNEGAAARLADPKRFPYATKSAKSNLISGLAVHKALPVEEEESRGDSVKRSVAAYPAAEPREDELFASLYDNIGGKIKGAAKFIFIAGAIMAIVLGVSMLNVSDGASVMVLLLGPVAAWLSSWMLYALGELVEKTAANERNTRGILKLMMEERKE